MSLEGARFFHINLNCSSLMRSRVFYGEALGFSEGVRTSPERPQAGAAFGLERAWWDASILVGKRGFDGGAIDLLEWREPAPVGAAPVRDRRCGFQRVGLEVTDFDAVIARLSAAGGRIRSAPRIHRAPTGPLRRVDAEDPDGIALELFEGDGAELVFVSVVCADLARSMEWYAALGLQEQGRSPNGVSLHASGSVAAEEILLAAPGGGPLHLLLTSFRSPAPFPAEARPLNAIGIARMALLVPSLDRCLALLDRLGIKCLSEPAALAMGPGLPELRFVCFAGPDREVLELIEQPRV